MSKPRAFRFSEEVEDILGNKEDPKRYIEQLITQPNKEPREATESPRGTNSVGTGGITEGRLSYLITQQTSEILEAISGLKNNIAVSPTAQPNQNNQPLATKTINTLEDFLEVYSDTSIKRPPHPIYGYPCCQKDIKCNHWGFNQDQAMWKNSLTGASDFADEF